MIENLILNRVNTWLISENDYSIRLEVDPFYKSKRNETIQERIIIKRYIVNGIFRKTTLSFTVMCVCVWISLAN